MTFDEWIDELETEVVQGEYGYEPGEFTVYPDHWRKLFDEGLTPSNAFRRALDAFADKRRTDEQVSVENWRRIQEADLIALAQRPEREAK